MLGIIPTWQFSADPTINPWLNPHVNMPDGWSQAYTVQPVGPNLAPMMVPQPSALGYHMIDESPQLGFVDSWAWEHRKLVAGITVGVVGLAILGGLFKVLK